MLGKVKSTLFELIVGENIYCDTKTTALGEAVLQIWEVFTAI